MNAGLSPQKPSTMLGRYRLLMELGHGGMAHVYLALVSGLAGFSKLVVLKVMRDELREHPASLNMFLGEARLAARMNHPNVVQTTEVGEDGGRYFICMEYLEGQTLSRLLKKTIDGSLPLAARLEIMCQMLEGLSYLHAFSDLDGTPLGLVHRDISPNNIFITFDGGVKVLDFGVAKAAGISHVTEAGTFKGKLGYAAPEQIVGRSDQRSDVFAAGVLLWEILTYRRLTQDRTQTEIVQGRIAGAESELMLQKGADVPRELMDICAKAASKSPDDRYPTAGAMRDAIKQYVAFHSLDYPSQKLRDLLQTLYQKERAEMRRQIDLRMKQANLEDEHPSEFARGPYVPAASTMFGGTSSGTNPGTSQSPPVARGKMFVAAGALALLAGVAGAFATRLRPAAEASTGAAVVASTAAPTEASKPTVLPAQALVQLRISAEPGSAELLLDGAKLEGNPFHGQLAKDSALHRLEVRAPGRKSDVRMIHLDHDLQLHIELPFGGGSVAASPAAAPATPAAAAAPAAAAPAGQKSPATKPATTSEDFVHKPRDGKAVRPIDNSDPYAN
ncbi:MAG: serine/threonine protein kinase [Polyangiaceae bacterium]|nr:serine/threonine protein kinase [Polyangiaceae bacterium]